MLLTGRDPLRSDPELRNCLENRCFEIKYIDKSSVGYSGRDAVPGNPAGVGADSRHHLSLRVFLRQEVSSDFWVKLS